MVAVTHLHVLVGDGGCADREAEECHEAHLHQGLCLTAAQRLENAAVACRKCLEALQSDDATLRLCVLTGHSTEL